MCFSVDLTATRVVLFLQFFLQWGQLENFSFPFISLFLKSESCFVSLSCYPDLVAKCVVDNRGEVCARSISAVLFPKETKAEKQPLTFFFWQPVEITRRDEFSQSYLVRHKVIKPVNDAKLPVIGGKCRNESCSLRRRRVRPTKMPLCSSGGVQWGRRAAAGQGCVGDPRVPLALAAAGAGL